MYTPTGYYAAYEVHLTESEIRAVFPIVKWDDDGRPVIANPGGRLITVVAHGLQMEQNFNEGPGDDCHVTWTVTPYHTS